MEVRVTHPKILTLITNRQPHPGHIIIHPLETQDQKGYQGHPQETGGIINVGGFNQMITAATLTLLSPSSSKTPA